MDVFQHYPRPRQPSNVGKPGKNQKCYKTARNCQITINDSFIVANFFRVILWCKWFYCKIHISKNGISFLAPKTRKIYIFSNFFSWNCQTFYYCCQKVKVRIWFLCEIWLQRRTGVLCTFFTIVTCHITSSWRRQICPFENPALFGIAEG